MPDLDQHVLGLLELLHEAPANPPAWVRFLDELRAQISPGAATVFVAQPYEGGDQRALVVGSGLGLRVIEVDEPLRPASRHPSPKEAPLGGVIEVPEHAAFQQSALYRGLLAPAGVQPGPGLAAVNERDEHQIRAATLVLPRTPAWRPTPQDRALLERLAPAMAKARQLHRRLTEGGRDTEALASAFDHLVLGVIFLDERMRVSYANRSAAESLGISAGFTGGPALAADEPDARTRALQPLLREAERGRDHGALVYPHPEDGRVLQVLVTPLDWRNGDALGSARFSRVLFIGDPKHRAGDPVRVLHDLYGLTRGETRLTLLLLAGCSVEEAAALLDIAIGTARGVLKKIFDKTHTNRQAALVRLLLTGFGQVRHGAPPEPPLRRRPAPSTSGRRSSG